MLRAKLSYQLFGIFKRNLPDRLAAKVSRLFRLKIPTTPAALAGSLMMLSDIIMKQLDSSILKITQENPEFVLPLDASEGKEFGVELVCALYCLALFVLGQDDFGAEQNVFHLFSVQTLDQLERLLEEDHVVALFQEIGKETRLLYLSDRPSLRELACKMGVKYFDEEIAKAERDQNWAVTFQLKSQIRVMSKIPINHKSIFYVGVARPLGMALMEVVDFFRTLRPVLAVPQTPA